MRNFIIINILAVLSAVAYAENTTEEDLTHLSLEELLNVDVVSASRLGQKASQAPSSVAVLTAVDIRAYGWRTLAEALNGLRGLYTTNNRNYTFLGVRGFIQPNDFNSRTLVMIDGQRMNENIYDEGNIAQEFMLDIDLIERIEFIPGSGSSIYGANAFLGLINVVTKKGRAINGGQVAGEAGTFDTYKGRISYGKKLANGLDVLVSASRYDSAGASNLYFPAYDKPDNNQGIAHNMDTERADRLFARFQFNELMVSGGFVDRFKRLPTAAFGQIFNDFGTFTEDRQFFGNSSYEKKLSDKSALLLKGFYQGYDYQAEDPYGDTHSRMVTHDGISGRWLGGDAQLTTAALNRQRIIMGVEYQYDQRQHQFGYQIDPYTVNENSHRNGHRVELYLQDDIQLHPNVVLSAGLRFDYSHMMQNLPLNPRLGLIWNPWDSTTFKLLYSSTFRAPNAFELTYNDDAANIQLNEERINSYEAITEWRSESGLKVFSSFFHNQVTDGLVANEHSDGYLMNIGRYKVYGAEMEAEKKWANGRHFKAAYTYNLLVDELENNHWGVGSPQQLFKLHYAEPLFQNRAKIGIESIYIGERRTMEYHYADAYNLMNLNLTSDRILKGLDASLGVYNLLDTRYEVVGLGVNDILNMNGREFRLKLILTI